MYGYHVVAVFNSMQDAESAKRQLINMGVSERNIRVSSNEREIIVDEDEEPGFFDWLFGKESPRTDRSWYRANLTGGRAAVSVLVPDDEDHLDIAETLVVAGALDLKDEEDPDISVEKVRGRSMAGQQQRAYGRGGSRGGGEEEEVIPVVNEELSVGKRAEQKSYRVRAHVIERPVEEDVTLRDERVIVERRPRAQDASANFSDRNWEDREFEVYETHEEPVVQKRTRANEEVVVRKQVNQRTEKVRDKVRQTEVDVQQGNAGSRGGRNSIQR